MKIDAEYKELSIREFTKTAEVYDGGHAGIYEMCKDDYPPIFAGLREDGFENLLDVGCGFDDKFSQVDNSQIERFDVEMRMHTLSGKLFAATFGKSVNNRLAVFAW